MKRVLLSITGTVLGVVALLSFKSHGPTVGTLGVLPPANVPTSSSSTTPRPGDSGTAAPPRPGSRSPATTSSTANGSATSKIAGDAVETPYGVVQVQITVSGKKIRNVSLLQLTAFDGRSQEINSQAAPILVQETLAAQSANIDTVSGASYTTAGYIQSLQSALNKAGI